jgi:hypothetical protein
LLLRETAGLRHRIFEGEVADIRTLVPDCPEVLARFFDLALARDAAARPASAAEMQERLRSLRLEIACPPPLTLTARGPRAIIL